MNAIKEAREKILANEKFQIFREKEGMKKLELLIKNPKSKIKFDLQWRIKRTGLKMQSDLMRQRFNKTSEPEDIARARPKELLLQDIYNLDKKHHLFTLKDFAVYCAPGHKIPNLMHEIGRLREITFREVGEGTNLSLDIDSYDNYYHQLVIWDKVEKRVVGGYRIGLGKEIMYMKGRNGFYTHSLFQISKDTDILLEQSMEMGRSYIVSDYQRKPLSLLILWKGILHFMLSNVEYRYLIGPVSISNDFSAMAQQLIVEYIEKNHFDTYYSTQIKSKKSFCKLFSPSQIKSILSTINSLQDLDLFIQKMENKRLPVLLKKYMQVGAKIACFNVDPLFNNSLDGFLILDLTSVPDEMIQTLAKEMDEDIVRRRFKCELK